MQKKGVLTPEYFEKIKGYWEQVSDIPLDALPQIAYGDLLVRKETEMNRSKVNMNADILDLYDFIISEKNLAEEFVQTVQEEDVIVLWGAGKALYWYMRLCYLLLYICLCLCLFFPLFIFLLFIYILSLSYILPFYFLLPSLTCKLP